MADMSAGATFAVTVMTPFAPTASIGRVSASSPDKTVKSSSHKRTMSHTCWRDPAPSLMPTMFRIFASRATV